MVWVWSPYTHSVSFLCSVLPHFFMGPVSAGFCISQSLEGQAGDCVVGETKNSSHFSLYFPGLDFMSAIGMPLLRLQRLPGKPTWVQLSAWQFSSLGCKTPTPAIVSLSPLLRIGSIFLLLLV